MRRYLWTGLLVLAVASPAAGHDCLNLLRLDCPAADSPDTACVTVYVGNCDRQIDAFGFEILYNTDHLLFVGADRSNTLVESWIRADAAPAPGDASRVRVGGYNLTGIVTGPQRPLIRLRFLVLTSFPFPSALGFVGESLTDDVVGFSLFDCVVPLPVEDRTWGGVKALYASDP
jgi:hypothetical protein